MALPLDLLRDHLAFTDDIGGADDVLLLAKLKAAQDHVERLLGYTLTVRFGNAEDAPPALQEAVLQLAAHWYDNREVVSENAREMPFGVREIVNEYREFTF